MSTVAKKAPQMSTVAKKAPQMSTIPKTQEDSNTTCRSDIILKNLFPKVKAALFDLASEYVKPGSTQFYCHFCKFSSEKEEDHKNHLKDKSHGESVAKRKQFLAELIESFYTALQNKSVFLQNSKQSFHVCIKCLVPYVEGAKKHRLTEEHNYSTGMIRPTCVKCNKFFSSRIELEIHQVTLDHIYAELAHDKRKEAESTPMKIPDEYDGNVPVGMAYIRPSSSQFCTPCGAHFSKTLSALKDHCATETHIENVKQMMEKLKPIREKRLQLEKEKEASKKKKKLEGSGNEGEEEGTEKKKKLEGNENEGQKQDTGTPALNDVEMKED